MLICLIVLLVILIHTVINIIIWPTIASGKTIYLNKVSVLIPARNEENNLAACLDTILAQGQIVNEILIYNDHSDDQTAEIVSDYQKKSSLIRAISCTKLPPKWIGKNYACWQLGQAAKGDWLLFLDADARLFPDAIGRLLSECIKREITFLSAWPNLLMVTWAEKILLPMLNFVVLSFFPFAFHISNLSKHKFNSKLGIAHGACMFFKRDTYLQFGGHETVYDQIFEDTRISQLWRQQGKQGLCLDGHNILYVRMYEGFWSIWYGFQKNFYRAFRHKANFWLYIFFHFTFYLTVFMFPFTNSYKSVNYMPLIIIILIRTCVAFRFKHPFLSIIFHPLSELVLIGIAITSWWKFEYGSGLLWKGRSYQKIG